MISKRVKLVSLCLVLVLIFSLGFFTISSAATLTGDYFGSQLIISQGDLISGSQASLQTKDGSYLAIRSKATGIYSNLDWTTNIVLPAGQVSALSLSYTGRYSTWRGQCIFLYNFTASTWDLVDYRTVGASIANIVLASIAGPANYVSPNRQVQVRIYSYSTASFTGYTDCLKLGVTFADTAPPPTPTLSFTNLTPPAVTTGTAPYAATLSAAGTNFNNVNRVTFAWSGAASGSYIWDKGGSDWSNKVNVNSDTSMTLQPNVVETSPTWSGTLNWTVTLRDTTGATASRSFTVIYSPPPPPPTLSFTNLTPPAVTTGTAPCAATLSAVGTNFNNVNRVTFTWSGAASGSDIWDKGGSDWNSKVNVNSDTSMTLQPNVVETSPTWSGTLNRTVTLGDTTGATASRSFTVTYNPPTPTPTPTPTPESSNFTSFLVTSGNVISGGQSCLLNKDGSYLTISSTATNGYSNVDWNAEAVLSNPQISKLGLSYTGRYSTWRGQSIFLYDFTAATWKLIDYRTVGASVANIVLPSIANPAKYVSANGQVRVRIYAYSTAGFTGYTDCLKLDITH